MSDVDEPLDRLKDELSRALAAGGTNYQEILRLASEISRHEPGVVRFRTDAAMVRRLGRELVAKQETALGELVKNAYDADATYCHVSLEQRADVSVLEIVDDGSGMTRAEIESGFMRLASDVKIKNPYSPKYRRSRAGRKGIGRFATERLGQRLTIVTQTAEEAHGWTISIDWSAFGQGEDIALIANTVAESPKERPHGTRLSIEGLRDFWSDADLRRVYRYLSTLLQPLFEEVEAAPTVGDPGFTVELTRGGVYLEAPQKVASANSEILDQALAVIEARIDSEGRATWSLAAPKLELAVADQPIGLGNKVEPLASARDVRMKAWYYIQLREFLGHSTGFIKKQLTDHGGVRLYRNGYRVPPYGEKNDDWLGLDAKRTTFYAPLNSKTFLGFVAITDPTGARFEETSSREGLIETEAFWEVREIISRVLEAAVRRIESARGKGRKRSDKQDPSRGSRAAKESEDAVNAVEDVFNALAGDGVDIDPEQRGALGQALMRLSAAARATADVARERDDLLKELNLLRILASMGLTMAEFTHDFSHLAETMELNLAAIERQAGERDDAFRRSIERLKSQFGQVRAYTAHFGSMMTSNASRDLQPIDLYAFARSFTKDLQVMFEKRGMTLTVERPVEYDIRTTRMHPSEWSSILLNLLTNAIKAAQRASRRGEFLIRVGFVDPRTVFLDFSDNGDGIAPENREQIFDAFFTTSGGTPVRASETAQALGTGLGLKIVADIAHSVGGVASVIDPPAGYTTCIRVAVPAFSGMEEAAQ